jgi:hypothetical protein
MLVGVRAGIAWEREQWISEQITSKRLVHNFVPVAVLEHRCNIQNGGSLQSTPKASFYQWILSNTRWRFASKSKSASPFYPTM